MSLREDFPPHPDPTDPFEKEVADARGRMDAASLERMMQILMARGVVPTNERPFLVWAAGPEGVGFYTIDGDGRWEAA